MMLWYHGSYIKIFWLIYWNALFLFCFIEPIWRNAIELLFLLNSRIVRMDDLCIQFSYWSKTPHPDDTS